MHVIVGGVAAQEEPGAARFFIFSTILLSSRVSLLGAANLCGISRASILVPDLAAVPGAGHGVVLAAHGLNVARAGGLHGTQYKNGGQRMDLRDEQKCICPKQAA